MTLLIMKNSQTVGQSEYTVIKEHHYVSILSWQVGVAKRAMSNNQKWRRTYLLIDATAGTGRLDDGSEGSPLKALSELDASGIQYRAVFIERDLASFACLNSCVGRRAELHNATYQQVIQDFCQVPDYKQLGLLYIDPNGTPDFDALVCFARSFPKMEILISVTANGVKRAGKTEIRLSEWIERIGKSHWCVRKPYGPWQWTFLFGSDTPYLAKPYKKIDLYPVSSDLGRKYLDQASLTKDELLKKVQPPLTGLIVNTCDIQPTRLFVPSQSGERAVSVNGVNNTP